MPLLGLFEIRAQHNFFISSQLGTALLVVTTVFVFTAIAAHTGTMLNLLDFKRRQAEEQLLRTEKLAAAGRLSATIAHEVNNPLAAVMNLLYLVKTADCSQTRLEYVRSAEAELRRACAMTTRALGFYKDETKPQELNLQELVSEILENEFLQKLSNANVQVNSHFHSAGRVYVRAGEIRQIISNLVGNAIDALQSSEKPEITIAVRENFREVELFVGDNGCGVPPEIAEKIFMPFFTTKRDVGTGLGLYISRELAQKNGGALGLESSTENGFTHTSFKLVLPMARTVLFDGQQ
jgi:signal transduction histidine kinase